MSFYDLSLGYADDPKFKWEGGDYSGNIPTIVVSFDSVGGISGCVTALYFAGKRQVWRPGFGLGFQRRETLQSESDRIFN